MIFIYLNKVLAILRQHESSPQTREIQKLIENMKVDVLGMFCYQGPPSKHWIDTKGQFWKGWNEACDKILEKLLAKKGSE